MSNLTECVELYRDDIAVTDDQFANLMLDAIARDSHAPAEPQQAKQDTDLADLMTPEQSARYLLVQFRTVQETLDLLGEAIAGLNELDTKRSKRLDGLADSISFLDRRMDVRAEEFQALNTRIESVTRQLVDRTPLRPV